MILTISQVAELKHDIETRFGAMLHFHDGCGGQSFSLEQPNEAVRQYLIKTFEAQKVRVLFSEDNTHFILEQDKSC